LVIKSLAARSILFFDILPCEDLSPLVSHKYRALCWIIFYCSL
jgi:hypothetical protein